MIKDKKKDTKEKIIEHFSAGIGFAYFFGIFIIILIVLSVLRYTNGNIFQNILILDGLSQVLPYIFMFIVSLLTGNSGSFSGGKENFFIKGE